MKKSILFVTRRFYPSVGGVEEQVGLLCKKFQEQDYETIVLTQKFDKNLKKYDEKNGVKIFYFSNYFHYIFLLFRLCYKNKFHFIMSHQFFEESVILGFLKFLGIIKSPVISCSHSGGENSEVMKIVKKFGFLKIYKILYFFIFQFEYINCLNKDIKNQLEKYIINGKEKYQKKLTFIPNGIEISPDFVFPDKKTEIKNFLYLGRFEKEKGIFETILAFKNIKNPEIVLNIVGYGDEKITEEIKKMISDDKRIFLLGKKTGKEKEEILKITDSSSSSSYSEGQPVTLMEFAKYNISIIASKVGNNEEIYGDEILYVKPGDVSDLQEKMEFLINNIKNFDYDYSEILEKLDINSIIKKYLNLFN